VEILSFKDINNGKIFFLRKRGLPYLISFHKPAKEWGLQFNSIARTKFLTAVASDTFLMVKGRIFIFF
jgi:hypothetical protein